MNMSTRNTQRHPAMELASERDLPGLPHTAILTVQGAEYRRVHYEGEPPEWWWSGRSQGTWHQCTPRRTRLMEQRYQRQVVRGLRPPRLYAPSDKPLETQVSIRRRAAAVRRRKREREKAQREAQREAQQIGRIEKAKVVKEKVAA